ncbi:MAG: hypothetical protein C0506_11170 [Anaerolinea sp.]|nr:hypothetical protein [Anaerolinea sp.]
MRSPRVPNPQGPGASLPHRAARSPALYSEGREPPRSGFRQGVVPSVVALLVLAWATVACGPPRQAPVQATAAPTVTPEVAAPRLTIQFLDVGQGDAILVTVDGRRLLVDGGPSRDRLHTRLQSLGIRDIDAVLVTNPDADHIRGLIEALAMFQVETFYSSASTNPSATYAELLAAVAMEAGIQVVTLVRGQFVPLGGVQLDVLHPLTISGDRNDDSLALKLTCENVTVLLMGDATTTSEESMLAVGLVPKADVVKAGHHGSRTSSGEPFVEALKPAYVIFSAARDSQYGHPHAEVVARYLAAGAQAVSTDSTPDDDTAVLTSDCQTYSVSGRAVGGAAVTPVPGGPAASATPAAAPSATTTLAAGG